MERNEPCCPLGSRAKGVWSGHASMTWALGGEGEALRGQTLWLGMALVCLHISGNGLNES